MAFQYIEVSIFRSTENNPSAHLRTTAMGSYLGSIETVHLPWTVSGLQSAAVDPRGFTVKTQATDSIIQKGNRLDR